MLGLHPKVAGRIRASLGEWVAMVDVFAIALVYTAGIFEPPPRVIAFCAILFLFFRTLVVTVLRFVISRHYSSSSSS